MCGGEGVVSKQRGAFADYVLPLDLCPLCQVLTADPGTGDQGGLR
ncbi:hypothetical protein Amir_1168 [Actinosynnema mirum DSM 43827]|uniref:Uncharacterized protein n=1 Tax=Actinosynnema mirum (strain ATCC 29888 / DSM 43827 / JCM 3225 / NBRC 14064 / NCIMB 13271 / NRRL B-12336 / IMRU 3971 / 101) TaxID=446462 RepID=C6WQ67_ACTMD|nr:hypothetical protein Amir_1168 [Actinosynnema mirum DSM 43827]